MAEEVVLRGPGLPGRWVVDGNHWSELWGESRGILSGGTLASMERSARSKGWTATAATLRDCLLTVGGDAGRLLAFVRREALWTPPPPKNTTTGTSVGVARGVVGSMANEVGTDVWEGRHE